MLTRIFIADDDIPSRDFLYELLSEVGFNVQTLATGEQLLDRLKRERPNFIILTDKASDFSGLSLVKKIRTFDKTIGVIMLAEGDPLEGLGQELAGAGVVAYLKKDFQDHVFIKNILSILKEARLSSWDDGGAESARRWGRVLIVDDEPENRQMSGSFLRRKGFDVDLASSGEECLEKVNLAKPDFVLLDVTMGGMDGLLTLKRIRQTSPQVEVVIVTAVGNKEVESQARDLGACDFIVKPFNLEKLESCLLSLALTKKSRDHKGTGLLDKAGDAL